MKSTARKGFLLLVLALLVVGGVFAQRVGDTRQLDGRDYRVAEVRSDGSILLQPVTSGLDGVWRGQTSGTVITISGNTGVYTSIGNHALMQDALSKGRIRVGSEVMRNVRPNPNSNRAGELIADVNAIQSAGSNAPNVNTGVVINGGVVITLSPDGRSFTLSGNTTNTNNVIDLTYTRQ